MLTISREAAVKVGKHAWNVFPLEAFGYLLGKEPAWQVLAALPCSRTMRWHVFDDRWNGIGENLENARDVARSFDLDLVGFYASTANKDRFSFPAPAFSFPASAFVMVYQTICCPRCSQFSFKRSNTWLERRLDFVVSRGKRLDSSVNQKKILKEWCRAHGPVDHSNLPLLRHE